MSPLQFFVIVSIIYQSSFVVDGYSKTDQLQYSGTVY